MYRIGIIVNENEVSHSAYADTVKTFRKSIEECNQNGKTGNSYYFKSFDKFNIHSLFDEGKDNIKSFDGIIIATNAMSSERVQFAFSSNKNKIEEFIDDNRGIFISSQKKLSNGSLTKEEIQSIGFLPENYDYYIFDRPEKYSSEGIISVASKNQLLLYPNKISEELISHRCENNEFIVHRYRSVIIPKHLNAYETLLSDTTAPIIQEKLSYINEERKVLLVSKFNRRIVVSTMALDWANHSELLSNILTFITGGQIPVLFVKRNSEVKSMNSIIESYIIRANIANLPYRVITEKEINEYSNFSESTFIFSQKWSKKEVEKKYEEILAAKNEYFSLYHISKSNSESVNDLKLSKYSNFSSIDKMKDEVIKKILSKYVSNSWQKSVWTYSYVINLIKFFDIDILIISKSLYKELFQHFTKKDERSGKIELVGSYDNVFNATCKMAEILTYFSDRYEGNISDGLIYNIDNVLKKTDEWLLSKIESISISDQDICYGALYLLSLEGYRSIDELTIRRISSLVEGIIDRTMSSQLYQISIIDLSRLYQVICQLWKSDIFVDKRYTQYIKQIESVLLNRQGFYGDWDNTSVTAEILVMILEVYFIRVDIDNQLNTLHILIARGVEAVHSKFNMDSSSWEDDLDTTAKAMHAIGAYNKMFNFAINDFFLDLNHHQIGVASKSGSENGIWVYEQIDLLINDKQQLAVKNLKMNAEIFAMKKRLNRVKISTLILMFNLAALFAFLVIIIYDLYIEEHKILYSMYEKYKMSFWAVILSIVATAIYEFVKKVMSKNNQQ